MNCVISAIIFLSQTFLLSPLQNSDYVVSVSIDAPSYSQQNAPFHCIAYDYSCADWNSLCDHLRDVSREDIFKLSVSAAASDFCKWVQDGIDVHIPHQKYQVKSHSSPWFLAACATSDKAKLFAENFSKNYNLDDSGISLPVFYSRTNLKLHISVTPKIVKKVIMNLDLSKASGPDCIPMVVIKNCQPELSYILAELFNKCLKVSCFPDY